MKKESKMLVLFLLVGLLAGIGLGYVLGTTYTVRAFASSLEYIENFEVNINMNETKMVEAMLPYIEDTALQE